MRLSCRTRKDAQKGGKKKVTNTAGGQKDGKGKNEKKGKTGKQQGRIEKGERKKQNEQNLIKEGGNMRWMRKEKRKEEKTGRKEGREIDK